MPKLRDPTSIIPAAQIAAIDKVIILVYNIIKIGESTFLQIVSLKIKIVRIARRLQ